MGELDFSLGSILLGTCFNTFLYGVVVFQYARYTIIPFRDPSWLKILVAFLFMMDTVHSASVIYMLYAYCVKKFGDEQFLNQVVWPYPWTVVQWAVICCATQNVLAFRIYRLNRNKALFAILSLASAVVFGLGTIVGIRSFILAKRSGYRELKTLRTMVAIWLGFQVATDLTINGYLAFLLSTSRTGFPSTDRLVNRLIKTAIQSGFFCSLFAIGDIIAFATRPTTSLYGIFAIPIGRIYTNALMDTLLVREKSSSPVTYDSTGSKNGSIYRFRGEDSQIRTVEVAHSESRSVNMIRRTSAIQKQRNDNDESLIQEISLLSSTPQTSIYPSQLPARERRFSSSETALPVVNQHISNSRRVSLGFAPY